MTGTAEDLRPGQRATTAAAPSALLATTVAGTFAVLYGVLAWAGWHRADSPSWDLAIFTQAIRHYAHLQAPVSEIKGPGFNLLGDHFSPLLAVLAPVYRVFPHVLAILLCQVALLAGSVLAVTGLALRVLGRRAGVCVGIAYGLSFGLQGAVASEFHEVALAVPLLAFALAAVVEDRPGAALCWAFPLVLVKEDLGLTVAAVGVVLLLRGHRRHGLAAIGVGLAASALEMLVVMPGINIIPGSNSGQGYKYWASLAPSTLTDGLGVKAWTLLALVAVTALVALRSPVLLVALPTLAWRFLGTSPTYWGTSWHYNAVLMPVVFVALVDGLRSMRGSPRRRPARVARFVPATCLGIAVLATAWLPLRGLVEPASYRGPDRADAARAVLALVPPGSVVETDNGLLNRLVDDRTVYWTTLAGSVVPDYIVLDTRAGWPHDPGTALVDDLRRLHPGTTYDVVLARDDYYVLARSGVQGLAS